MSKYLDTIHEGNHQLGFVEFRLTELANAFHITGNSRVAETLYDLASIVGTAAKDINRAVTEELNRRVEDGQRTNRAIVEAALAGIAVAKEE